MRAVYDEITPPSGVEFATTLQFTPSSLPSSSSATGKVLTNLVTARSNYLWLYEVREVAAVLPSLVEDEKRREKRKDGIGGDKERRGTEAVEGEVEMDT